MIKHITDMALMTFGATIYMFIANDGSAPTFTANTFIQLVGALCVGYVIRMFVNKFVLKRPL